jgi:putative ABC transport system substrate-binding protein
VQQPAVPVIGFLSSSSLADRARYLPRIPARRSRNRLRRGPECHDRLSLGQDQHDVLPDLAADLVRGQVTVIAAHGTSSAVVAKAATTTIPIVFVCGGDPGNLGLVASLNRLGSNVTGITFVSAELGGKTTWAVA